MLCVWEGKTAIFDDELQFDPTKARKSIRTALAN